jgi:hypothetical protein
LIPGKTVYFSNFTDQLSHPIKELKKALTFGKDYFSFDENIKIPKEEMKNLNFNGVIPYVYRMIDN